MSVGSKRHSAVTSKRWLCAASAAVIVLFVVVWHFAGEGEEGFRPPEAQPNGMGPSNQLSEEEETPEHCVGRINFPRARIPANGCEGYFARTPTLALQEGLPFPEAHPTPFCGAKEWARRLRIIEEHAEAEEKEQRGDVPVRYGIRIERQRGLAVSRLTGSLLGNQEFSDWYAVTNDQGVRALAERSLSLQSIYAPHSAVDAAEEIRRREAILTRRGDVVCWTQDLLPHYVLDFHVVPSREFYEYVLQKFDIIVAEQQGSLP